jgi:lysophospholipase L1-like esterase
MALRIVLFTLTLSILPMFSIAQQAESDAIKAVQDLERYRETQIPLWMSDFGNLQRYRESNAELPPPPAKEARVVFLGDSITDSWELARYFPGKPYINRSISGQTTPQLLLRFRSDVLNLHPKVVVILAGTNDIAGNTGPMSIDAIVANLNTMSELARFHGIRVVLASITPVNGYTPTAKLYFPLRPPAQIAELNRLIREYCASNDCVYLDYFSAMLDDKGLLKADLSDDGLHPNERGYSLMAARAQKAIDQALTWP